MQQNAFLAYLFKLFILSKRKIMRKNLLSIIAVALLFAATTALNAQVLLNESFNYPAGNLAGNGNWAQVGSVATTPIQVGTEVMSYTNYVTTPVGKSVILGDAGQDVTYAFGDQTSGSVYVGCIINFSQVQHADGEYFLTVTPSGATTAAGRVYVRKSDNGMQFGVSRAGAATAAIWNVKEYALNTPHLLIFKYEIVEGEKNDKVSLFVDPVISDKEPTPTAISFDETSSTDRLPGSIQLRQGTAGKTPLGILGQLKVTTTWASLFDLTPLPTNTTPILNVSTMSINNSSSYIGSVYKLTFNVKGEGLVSDIAVTSSNTSEISAATTIAQSAIETAEGYDFEITLNPIAEGKKTETISLSYGASDPLVISIAWNALANTSVTAISGLRAVTRGGELGNTRYRLTGEAVVTSVRPSGLSNLYTIQDGNAGIVLFVGSQYTNLKALKVGDKVKNIVGSLDYPSSQSLRFKPLEDIFEFVSENNEVTPQVVTPAAWIASADSYDAKLIKIEDVKFTSTSPTSYVAGASGFAFEDASANTIKMSILSGTDIVGASRPESTKELNVTGVSLWTNDPTIEPRSLADIVLKEATSINENEFSPLKIWGSVSTINIESSETATISIYTIAGMKVAKKQITTGNTTIPLQQGVYLVSATVKNGSFTTKVFVK